MLGTTAGAGNLDGTGAVARFSSPSGLVRDAAGNVYVADSGNFTVRKISPSGQVSTLAGSAGVSGFADGAGSQARFSKLVGMALDRAGNVFVTDAGRIRKVTPTGLVSTLQVSPTSDFALDGIYNTLALDGQDNFYATSGNNIRRVTSAGRTSVFPLTGSTYVPDRGVSDDGRADLASFNSPYGIAVAADGSVFVSEPPSCVVRKISILGFVSTLAGTALACGSTDGVGNAARLSYPTGMTLDASGNVVVAESGTARLRQISPQGVVTTRSAAYPVAQQPKSLGYVGLALDAQGVAYVADTVNSHILKIEPDGATAIWAGSSDSRSGHASLGLSADVKGNLYALRISQNPLSPPPPPFMGVWEIVPTTYDIVKITPVGELVPQLRFEAWMLDPRVAIDRQGSFYWLSNSTVRPTGTAVIKSTPAGVTSTVWSTTAFSPTRVEVDGSGSVYVAGLDAEKPNPLSGIAHRAVRLVKISPTGEVLDLLKDGLLTVPAAASRIEIASIGSGNLVMASANAVRLVSPTGLIQRLAGRDGQVGSTDGAGMAALFGEIRSLVADLNGNLYAADTTANTVRKITPQGVVTTVVGKSGSIGMSLGDLPGSLAQLKGLALGPNGNTLYIDTDQAVLRVTLP